MKSYYSENNVRSQVNNGPPKDNFEMKCPVCRHQLPSLPTWYNMEEAIEQMRKELISIDERVKICHSNYQDRLRKKDVEVGTLEQKIKTLPEEIKKLNKNT